MSTDGSFRFHWSPTMTACLVAFGPHFGQSCTSFLLLVGIAAISALLMSIVTPMVSFFRSYFSHHFSSSS